MQRMIRPMGLSLLERLSRRSYADLFSIWLLIDVGFALGYFSLALTHPHHAPTFPKSLSLSQLFLDSVYFSTITTTTIGFGDIIPMGFSKFLAAAEGVLGFGTFGLFMAKLVSQKQDVAIHEMHRMTFESIFHNIRHGLFVVRKDFDTLIHQSVSQHTFHPHDWENLVSAYLQAQSLLEEIPDFYTGSTLYTIDAKREILLFDAVRRTLERIRVMLGAMTAHKIPWRIHAMSVKELKVLLESVSGLVDTWKENAQKGHEEYLQEIRLLQKSVAMLVLEKGAKKRVKRKR